MLLFPSAHAAPRPPEPSGHSLAHHPARQQPLGVLFCRGRLPLLYASFDAEILGEIRQSTNGNLALGNERFKKQIEKALGQRARRGKSGRPRQQEADDA